MSKTILFITTANLASNPRLLKELRLAKKLGYQYTFVGFDLGNWSELLEPEIRNEFADSNLHYLSATRKSFFPWLLSSASEWFFKLTYPLTGSFLVANALGSSKRSFQLLFFLLFSRSKADLIIGHNLGALYPCYLYAAWLRIPFGFDIEDYHPGESINTDCVNEKKRREYVLKKLLPKCVYFSFASPLIGSAIKQLLTSTSLPENIFIGNSFPEEEFIIPSLEKSSKLAFVWFSQNINAGRGLELVIPTMYKYKEQVKLVLIGNLNTNFFEKFLKPYKDVLELVAPLSQKELHNSFRHYDIGMAIDLNQADYNREIALTNKIIAYLQAGLFIFATDTPAQVQFIADFPEHGLCVPQNEADIEDAIGTLLEKKKIIREQAISRYEMGKNVSWEIEEQKLSAVWKKIGL
jgi:glycosyltransferase involved in cell wall biosynthesis